MIYSKKAILDKVCNPVLRQSATSGTRGQLAGIHVHKTFIDTASGKNTARPELEAMIDYARNGDTIIVHSMDRFARNLARVAN